MYVKDRHVDTPLPPPQTPTPTHPRLHTTELVDWLRGEEADWDDVQTSIYVC